MNMSNCVRWEPVPLTNVEIALGVLRAWVTDFEDGSFIIINECPTYAEYAGYGDGGNRYISGTAPTLAEAQVASVRRI